MELIVSCDDPNILAALDYMNEEIEVWRRKAVVFKLFINVYTYMTMPHFLVKNHRN